MDDSACVGVCCYTCCGSSGLSLFASGTRVCYDYFARDVVFVVLIPPCELGGCVVERAHVSSPLFVGTKIQRPFYCSFPPVV